jgi:hypothetical protein
MIGDLGRPPGLDWFRLYEAVVVDNEDPRKLCRLRVRVKKFFDDISDEYLPWAGPFTDYSVGEHADWGVVNIPAKDSKVLVAFQNGSVHHPIYMGYLVDEKTQMYEMLENYPNRRVHLMPDKSMVLIDSTTNEVMIRSMGDLHLYVMGNIDLTVNGNLTERVLGDRELYVEGKNTEHIVGDNLRVVDGDNTAHYKQNSSQHVDGNNGDYATGSNVRTGKPISNNPGAGAPKPPKDPKKPQVVEWKGVRWDQPKDKN